MACKRTPFKSISIHFSFKIWRWYLCFVKLTICNNRKKSSEKYNEICTLHFHFDHCFNHRFQYMYMYIYVFMNKITLLLDRKQHTVNQETQHVDMLPCDICSSFSDLPQNLLLKNPEHLIGQMICMLFEIIVLFFFM